eukprot:m.429294 g.429294  ORF g.429294 m.429294 type:complete len:94 (-) comp16983_c0_seq1:285-566(-)
MTHASLKKLIITPTWKGRAMQRRRRSPSSTSTFAMMKFRLRRTLELLSPLKFGLQPDGSSYQRSARSSRTGSLPGEEKEFNIVINDRLCHSLE